MKVILMKIKHLSFVVAISLFGSGCGGGSGSNSETNSAERTTKNMEFWGEWQSLDNSSNKIYVTTQTGGTIESVQENLVKIDGKYYMRTGARNINFSGSVYDDGAGRTVKGFESIANIEIVLKSSLDDNIKTNIKSDENGSFKDSSLPAGDYSLTVNDDNRTVETNVSLVRDGQDIGSFQLVPKGLANFQTNFESSTEFFYGNGQIYNGEIIVKNIGYDVGRGLSFEISLDDAKTFTKGSVLGSIPIGTEKRIPVTFSFNEQIENEKNYNLLVKIKDSSNRVWQEKGLITVYKTSFNLNMKSQVNLNGTLKYPSGKSITINNSNVEILLPTLSSDKSYTLSLINYGDLAKEGIYGISTNGYVSTSKFDSFSDPAVLEPNDKLNEATIINVGSSQTDSYIHYEDIDYFKFISPQINKTVEEINNIAPTVKFYLNNDTVLQGSEKSLSFSGSDDVGIEKFVLSSSIDGQLYSGLNTSFSMANLSEGTHILTLKGYDQWNSFGEASKILVIKNSNPVAVLGVASSVGLNELISFDFNKSYDDIGIAKYELNSSIDGLLYSGDKTNFITKSPLSKGSHIITLKVTDKFGKTSSINKNIEVADGSPRTSLKISSTNEDIGNEISFDFSDSYDDLAISRFVLTDSIDGTIYDSSSSQFGNIFKISTLSEGTHKITLKAYDEVGHISEISKTISITNDTPVAKVSVNKTSVYSGEVLEFSFAGSSDNSGIAKYELSSSIDGNLVSKTIQNSVMINSAGVISFVKKDKPENIINDSYEYINDSTTSNSDINDRYEYMDDIPSLPLNLKALKTVIDNSNSTFSTANLSIGNHIITLTVYDKWGKSSQQAINVNVLKNYSPTAILKLPIGAFKTKDQLTLNGGSSYDTDGSITKYLFSSNIDGELSNSSSSYTYEYLSEGTHTITLTVTDNRGATSSTTETITINPPEKPKLSFSGSETADVNRTANFSVTSDKSNISYVWYIDGVEQNSYNSSFSYIFTNIGNYLVSVKGTSENVSSTASINVEAIERNVTNSKVLKTGQTINDSIYSGDDGSYEKGLERKYSRDDSQGIVTDLTTGFMWQDNSDAKTVTKNWQGAIDYCNSLTLGGYSNWRLPTLKEMTTIVDYGRYDPAIDPVFQNVSNSWYWTSTISKTNTSYSWILDFSYGDDNYYNQNSYRLFRCVR